QILDLPAQLIESFLRARVLAPHGRDSAEENGDQQEGKSFHSTRIGTDGAAFKLQIPNSFGLFPTNLTSSTYATERQTTAALQDTGLLSGAQAASARFWSAAALCRFPSARFVSSPGLVTILEAIQRSTEFLAKKGVDSPRLQTELLLAHALNLPRMRLYLSFEREISQSEQDHLRELIKRRGQREPLQHILGSVSFCGLEIAVSRAVLIPRPETELLAEHGWTFLSQLPAPETGPPTVLDWGTGSGCLAVALAVKSTDAQFYA